MTQLNVALRPALHLRACVFPMTCNTLSSVSVLHPVSVIHPLAALRLESNTASAIIAGGQ